MRCGPHLGLAAVTRSVATLKELIDAKLWETRYAATPLEADWALAATA